MDVNVTFDSETYSPFLSRYLELKLRMRGVEGATVVIDIEKKDQIYHLDCSMSHFKRSFKIEEDFAVNPKHAIDSLIDRLWQFYSSAALSDNVLH